MDRAQTVCPHAHFFLYRMQITFNKLKPVFLEQEKLQRSQLWQQQLQFEAGSHLQIVAPSGSGKTSLVHFIYGIRSDYDGDILLQQQQPARLGADALAQLRAGTLSIIFQDLRLFAHQTAFENIEVKRRLDPYHPAERIHEMAAMLGIQNKLQQKAQHCSYGEQQRIAIIRALMQPFAWLLMDEPFSHLDEANAEKALYLIMAEAAARNAGIILAGLQPLNRFPAHKTIYL